MRSIPAVISAFLLLLTPVMAAAQGADVSQVTLLDGWRMENGRHMGAVRIALAPGWKTYWRAPGANGIPPEFDWSGSENIASVRIHWPRPEVFDSYGTRTVGYKNTVVMPIEFTPEDPAKPISVRLEMFYGVCEDVCIPARADLTGLLPLGRGSGMEAINAALATQPDSASQSGVASVTCVIEPAGGSLSVSADIRFNGEIGAAPFAVFELPSETMWFTEATTEVIGRSLRAQAMLETYAKGGAMAIDREAIRLTLLGHDRAIDISGCPAG